MFINMILWEVFFLFTVGFTQFDSLSSSFIKAEVNGSLEESGNITFIIFVKRSVGLALYATDNNNKLLIKFATDSIIFAFNSQSKTEELNNICGCSICYNFLISFDIIKISNNISFYTQCGNKKKEIKLIDKIYNNWEDFPIHINDKPNHITNIWMGNKEIFKIDNYDINPFKEQLDGCLDTFSYKNKFVSWEKGNSKYFQSTCMKTCLPKLCNEGICLEKIGKVATCNCSLTAMNGNCCERDFMDYNIDNNTLFEVSHSNETFDFKLSWKHENITNYCLLELYSKNFHKIINVDKNMIKYNNEEVIQDILQYNNYFLNIKFSLKYISIWSKKIEKSNESIKINVGFSKNGNCETFKGKYDVYYDTSQIMKVNETEKKTGALYIKYGISHMQKLYILPIIFVGAIGFMTVLIFIIINIIMRLWEKKLQINENQIRQNIIQSRMFMNPESNAIYDALDYGDNTIDYMEPVYYNHHGQDNEAPALPPRN